MFKKLRKIFEKEKWDSASRYGMSPESMLILALKIAPPHTRFEVSEENTEEYRQRYLSWIENTSMAFGTAGVTLRINDGLIAKLEMDLLEKLIGVPEGYCLVHDSGFLLSVMNQGEVIDFTKEFEGRLSAESAKTKDPNAQQE